MKVNGDVTVMWWEKTGKFEIKFIISVYNTYNVEQF